ncbi:MAG: DNA primase, partial [Eubacteriales bacterium]|nr:DNA primase [Eubacteriales bacterium]
MRQVAAHLGFKANRSGFIYSPFRDEVTPSCKLYDHSYYDFGAGCGGDLIQFTAAVLGTNNWEAC